ncbi:family 20 glycosylhydrolase [Streptomyces cirratus]|uniref:family 20 glycosylhydrolase n=1 Tax=Streptomyces cirratus TaxID=68187 RepID=UPI003614C0BD
MRLLRFLIAAVCTVFALALPGAGTSRAAASAPPQTVPALRQWTAGTGSYTFTGTTRIAVDPAYTDQLSDEAATFAEDLRALTGRGVTVITGSAAPGDIGLSLGDPTLPAEGYRMTAATSLTIRAATDTGAFNGTRTVLQLLHRSLSLPAGTAVDWPAKAERGLMVDQGRKFFTVDWLKQHIKELAYLKLNTFHFHLSDTFGFRLESSAHPEIVSTDHYTKQDIADLVALGRTYHVTIVPEIDTPGHMNAVLAAHPELRLKSSSGALSPDFIDLSLPASYTLVKDLINEYLPLFPGPYWHIGADEYVTDYAKYPQLLDYARAHYGANATAKDTFYGFVNWADALVRAGGKTTRMWNDGIKSGDGTLGPNAGIVVEYWYTYGLTPSNSPPPGTPSPTTPGRPPTTYSAAPNRTPSGCTRAGPRTASKAAPPSPTRRGTPAPSSTSGATTPPPRARTRSPRASCTRCAPWPSRPGARPSRSRPTPPSPPSSPPWATTPPGPAPPGRRTSPWAARPPPPAPRRRTSPRPPPPTRTPQPAGPAPTATRSGSRSTSAPAAA